MYPISSEELNRETEEAIYFFTPAFHVFDNFSAHQIEIWDNLFSTVEHAFQWKKFSDISPEIAERILRAKSPDAVKKISNAYKDKVPSEWHQEKVSVMEQLLRVKIKQHEDVSELLLKTGQRQIIENSPVDSFWGIGPNQDGQNIVGKLYMKLRKEVIGDTE